MARFLSAAWLEQAAAAADDLPDDAGGVSLTVRQVVRGGPEGEVTYSVRMGHGKAAIVTGEGTEADVQVVSDYATAVAISKGELSPAVALASGYLSVTGKVGLLVEHREAWASLDDRLAALRASTEY